MALLLFVMNLELRAADATTGTAEVKTYLLGQVAKVNQAASDFLSAAEDYQRILDTHGGDYARAAQQDGTRVFSAVSRMREDYLNIHMRGYETVEGIAAGVKDLVPFDIYLDSGVPKAEASTDSPAAPIVLKTESGEIVNDYQGNLFHYVIEPLLWGGPGRLVKSVPPTASAQVHGWSVLPRSDVALAAAKDTVRECQLLTGACERWQPTVAECLGALVWMTPTFNSYYDDLKESLYNAKSFEHISESRVKDMRGIMGSLQLVYTSLAPLLESKDSALSNQLRQEYQNIMAYIDETDTRDQKSRFAKGKLSLSTLEEMSRHAKTLSDQLAPQLLQAAAILGVRVPLKPGSGGSMNG